jgi:colanic acid biosynthesis glycosyl transferase WcaI
VTFLINGGGSALQQTREAAAGLSNVRFGQYQPKQRLGEVLATGDVHVVPLRRGLAASSVPSKTYSILAAGRPVLASIDEGTEVTRIVEAAQAGRSVAPDNPPAFIDALRAMLADQEQCARWGRSGRAWVERAASPAAVAAQYEDLFRQLR